MTSHRGDPEPPSVDVDHFTGLLRYPTESIEHEPGDGRVRALRQPDDAYVDQLVHRKLAGEQHRAVLQVANRLHVSIGLVDGLRFHDLRAHRRHPRRSHRALPCESSWPGSAAPPAAALRYQHVIAGQDGGIAANLNRIARRALGEDH